MQFALNVGLPALVIFTMTVVGMELSLGDFANLRRHPRAIASALLGQWFLVPLAAIAVIQAMSLAPSDSIGLLLIATAPIAALANYYALLARANLALSVTLTAVSCLAATFTMPLMLHVSFRLLSLDHAAFELPAAKVLQQVAIGLLCPVLAGMTIRHLAPKWVEHKRRLLRALSLAALGAIVSFIVVDQFPAIRSQTRTLIAAALLYTLMVLAIGAVISRFGGVDLPGARALLFGFPARNISIAILVAVAAFGRTDMAVIGTIVFLVQATLLVPVAMGMAIAVPHASAPLVSKKASAGSTVQN